MPELAVVVPTWNEAPNLEPLLQRLDRALEGLAWEVVFVDDDSADGTASQARQLAQGDPRIRILQRVGRSGLASACIEGMLATTAPYIAVMDADLQHDESILPHMLEVLRRDGLDVVVGSRLEPSGDDGERSRLRRLATRWGAELGRCVCHCRIQDPMSGFFVLDRRFLDEVAHRLSGIGFKILVDLLASARRPVLVGEVPYRFRPRLHGRSKLNRNTLLDYLALVGDKVLGGWVPARFVVFSLVGLTGLFLHLAVVGLLMWRQAPFLRAQVSATVLAMTSNFILNNILTFQDRQLAGRELARGLVSFYAICSVGALINYLFARYLFAGGLPWFVAGTAGLAVGSVWNYGVNSALTWQRSRAGRRR